MKIAHVIDSLHWGGVQELLVTLATAAQRGKEIDLTVISLRQDEGTPYPSRLRALGAQVEYFPAPKLLDPARFMRLFACIRTGGFDLVHVQLPYANTVGTFAAWSQGIPVLSTLHLLFMDPHPVRRQIETLALRRNRCVIAVGETVAAVHQPRLGGKKITILPNPAIAIPSPPPEGRSSIRRELVGDASGPVILSVGRLAPVKGYEDLIQAAAILKKSCPSFHLLIAGSGVLHEKLAEQIRRLDLDRQVTLLGARDDVPRLLRGVDLYVNASNSEAMPVSIIEAMQSGLPVVATSVGENPRLVVKGTGEIVPPGDPEALARAIQSLLDQPGLLQACGDASREHILRTYSTEAWYEAMLSIYRKVLVPAG